MSNQFQTVSSGLAELKNYYEGPIVDEFNEDCPVYRAAEKRKKGWSGLQVIRPVRVRRNQGIGATSDNGNLPSIGRQTTQQAIIGSKYNYLRFGITGPMIKASQSDVGSFVRSAAYELEMGYKDLMSDCNRQLGWQGDGTLATLGAAALASTSLTVAGRESVEFALKFLDVGMVIDIWNSAFTVLKASQLTIQSITGAPTDLSATIVVNSPVTASSTDCIVRAGTSGNEIQGLLTEMDGGTSTVFNIDRSLYPIFQSNQINLNGSLQLKLDSMQQAYNEGLRRGGSKYSAAFMDFDSIRYYQKLLTQDKRYSNTVQGDGGFAKKDKFYLEFNGVPLVPDKDSPQRIFFVQEDSLKAYVLAEMEFADETGSMYIAQTGQDSLECRVRFFMNLFNEMPSACAVLKGYLSP